MIWWWVKLPVFNERLIIQHHQSINGIVNEVKWKVRSMRMCVCMCVCMFFLSMSERIIFLHWYSNACLDSLAFYLIHLAHQTLNEVEMFIGTQSVSILTIQFSSFSIPSDLKYTRNTHLTVILILVVLWQQQLTADTLNVPTNWNWMMLVRLLLNLQLQLL